jgi:hypothetical protein
MTALLKQRMVRVKKAGGMDFPVEADAVIFKGAFCVLKAGYLTPALEESGDTPAGLATEDVDATGLSSGDVSCHVNFCREKTLVPMISGVSLAQTDMGKTLYLKDDQTVTTDDSGTTALGTVWKFEEANSVQTAWVEV